jgi:hypothetical protein
VVARSVSRVPQRLVFESFGVVAALVSDDESRAEELTALLPPGWAPADGAPEAEFGLTRDGAISIDGTMVLQPNGDRATTLRRFGSTVRLHLALKAPNRVFIHAGVVSVGGAAIVIPGTSRSGKSTLVDALVRCGATYHSDEYAVVDADGVIEPYAKPLSLRLDRPDEPGVPVPVPEEQIATGPIRCGLIVVTRYETGARWQPVPMSKGEGALALLRNTVAAQHRPGDALAAVSHVSRTAEVISGARGEADVVARDLLERHSPRGMSPTS